MVVVNIGDEYAEKPWSEVIVTPTCDNGSPPRWLASISNQFASSTIEELSVIILVSTSGQSTTVSLVSERASIIVVELADATPAPPPAAGSVND